MKRPPEPIALRLRRLHVLVGHERKASVVVVALQPQNAAPAQTALAIVEHTVPSHGPSVTAPLPV
jgi:hypothetical protein